MKIEGPPCTGGPQDETEACCGCQFFLIFSSILKIPFGAPTNMRLKVLGEATPLERVAAGSGTFGHVLSSENPCAGDAATMTGEKAIFYNNLIFPPAPSREALEPVLPARGLDRHVIADNLGRGDVLFPGAAKGEFELGGALAPGHGSDRWSSRQTP